MDILKDIETESLGRKTRDALLRKAKEGDLKRVFHPGSGGKPPLLVGRREQADRINGLLEEVLLDPSEVRDIHAVTLHGPRGVGKSVLMGIAEQAVEAEKNLGLVRLGGASLLDAAALYEGLRAKLPADTTVSTETNLQGEVDWNAFVAKAKAHTGVKRSKSRPDGPSVPGLAGDILLRYSEMHQRRPVVLIDEAHDANPQALGILLDDIHDLNVARRLCCGAILAGTPDLISVLQEADVTWYFDRNEEERLVPVGGIVDADCARAVEVPLEAMEVGCDASALQAAASWCSGNAYFTQLLGRSALEAAAKDGDGFADFSAGGPVWERFRAGAVRRYTRTWNAIDELGLTGCARQLGALWRWGSAQEGRTIHVANIHLAIMSGLKHPPTHQSKRLSEDEAKARFMHLGLLWSPSAIPDGPWEVGLPSFFDHVEGNYLNAKWHHYHATLPALVADEASFIPEETYDDGTQGSAGGQLPISSFQSAARTASAPSKSSRKNPKAGSKSPSP